MPVIRRAFLLGVVSGLRAFTGVAPVTWAARSKRLNLKNTKLAFLGHWLTPYVASAIALGEFVGDTLPFTPDRTVPLAFAGRVATGALCGSAVGTAGGDVTTGLIAGAIGGVVGTVGGIQARKALAKACGVDLPAALLEDAVAVAIAALALSSGAVRLQWSAPAATASTPVEPPL